MINVDLKGTVRQYEAGVTAADVAKSIGMGLYKSACAAKVNGEVCDLRTPLNKDCALEILTFEDEGGKHAFWHTAAHVMAQAVQHLFPGAHFGIGPAAGKRLVLRHQGRPHPDPVRLCRHMRRR